VEKAENVKAAFRKWTKLLRAVEDQLPRSEVGLLNRSG
jgi:hypothetical protein